MHIESNLGWFGCGLPIRNCGKLGGIDEYARLRFGDISGSPLSWGYMSIRHGGLSWEVYEQNLLCTQLEVFPLLWSHVSGRLRRQLEYAELHGHSESCETLFGRWRVRHISSRKLHWGRKYPKQ